MPCSPVSTVAMDVGEAAITQHLESVSVNRDTSLIVTAKLASTSTNAAAKTNVPTTAQTQRVHLNAAVRLDTNFRMMEYLANPVASFSMEKTVKPRANVGVVPIHVTI